MRMTQLLAILSLVSLFDVVLLFDLGWSKSHKKILMSEVEALTFYNKKITTRRRSSPVPQLNCIGGCSSGYKPETASCVNMDFDGYDAQWDCRADMPSEYSFGNINVSCEGYDYPDDPYILARSCGLSYSLKKDGCRNYNADSSYSYSSSSTDLFDTVVWFVMVGLVCYVIYKVCTKNRQSGPSDSNYNQPPLCHSPFSPAETKFQLEEVASDTQSYNQVLCSFDKKTREEVESEPRNWTISSDGNILLPKFSPKLDEKSWDRHITREEVESDPRNWTISSDGNTLLPKFLQKKVGSGILQPVNVNHGGG